MHTFSLFGVTNRFEVFTADEATFTFIKDEWITISSTEVELTPNSEMWIISRRIVGNKCLTWIGLYRYSIEMGVNRGGGFYGAGIWLLGKTIRGNIIFQILNKFADNVNELGIKDNQFVKLLVDIQDKIDVPVEEINTANKTMFEFTGGGLGCHNVTKSVCFDIRDYNDYLNIGWFIDWIQTAAPLSDCNRIIISSNDNIVNSIISKDRYKIITPLYLLKLESNINNQLLISRSDNENLKNRLSELDRTNSKQNVALIEINNQITHYQSQRVAKLIGNIDKFISTLQSEKKELESIINANNKQLNTISYQSQTNQLTQKDYYQTQKTYHQNQDDFQIQKNFVPQRDKTAQSTAQPSNNRPNNQNRTSSEQNNIKKRIVNNDNYIGSNEFWTLLNILLIVVVFVMVSVITLSFVFSTDDTQKRDNQRAISNNNYKDTSNQHPQNHPDNLEQVKAGSTHLLNDVNRPNLDMNKDNIGSNPQTDKRLFPTDSTGKGRTGK